MKKVFYIIITAITFYLFDSFLGFIIALLKDSNFEFFTYSRLRSSILSGFIFLFYFVYIKKTK